MQKVAKIHLLIIISETGADEQGQGHDGDRDDDAPHAASGLFSTLRVSCYEDELCLSPDLALLLSHNITCGASLSMLKPAPYVDSVCLMPCVYSEPNIHNS